MDDMRFTPTVRYAGVGVGGNGHEEAVSGDGGRLRQGAVSGPDRVVRFALGSVALGLVILSFFL
ncbi:MAG: hypothetical protein WDA27_03275, partial [Actinomycetota bacterium]